MEELRKLLKEKHSYYNKEKIRIEKELAPLSKGSITKRKIYNQYFYYRSYRNEGKVHHDYLGKQEPKKLIRQIEKRRQLEKELREVKKALKMLRTVRPKIT